MRHRRGPAPGRRTAWRVAVVTTAAVAVLAGCLHRRAGNGTFEQEARRVLRSAADQRPWFCNAVGDGTPIAGHGNGGHVHPIYEGRTKGPLSAEDCLKLAGELDTTVKAVKGFETKGKAEAAGWREVAPYVPGLGTHHVRMGGAGMPSGSMPGGDEINRIRQCLADKGVDLSGGFPDPTDPAVMEALRACGVPLPGSGEGGPGGMGGPGGLLDGSFDPAKPPILIFGGSTPDAPLVGVGWAFAGADTPPEAYTGGNDWWHLHTRTCFGVPVEKIAHIDTEHLSDEECRALGGEPRELFPGRDGRAGGVWLLHLWMIKPYEYRPDLFVSGHNCLLDTGVAPKDHPCWKTAHHDPADGPPPAPVTSAPASTAPPSTAPASTAPAGPTTSEPGTPVPTTGAPAPATTTTTTGGHGHGGHGH